MSIGLRVVRGPDWKQGEKDGGEGHLGTVVCVKENNSVDVVWDNGNLTTCNIGKDGRRELRVVDNAPAGIKHYGIACNVCKRQPILGTRWKCGKCSDINLCTICYFSDKHDLSHEFERYNRQTTSRPEKVKKRAISQKMRALGIFPGAVVTRGKDWNYGKDDGGSGTKGTVTELKNYKTDTGARNAVHVKWTNGKTCEYRVGASGKMDLIYVEPGVGTDYYRDHLYIPDSSQRLTREYSFIGDKPKPKEEEIGFLEKNLDEADNPGLDSVLHVGDRVCVFIPSEELKEVQRGKGGWSMRMTECIGKIGIVKQIESNDIIEVQYDGISWQFYQGAVRKVYNVKQGDTVKILPGEKVVELLQRGHGGWEDAMKKACGKIGKVEKVDSDGDVVVQFGQQVWVYSPACLIPAPGQKVHTLELVQTQMKPKAREESTRNDLSDSLARLVAHMVILGHQQRMQTIGPEQMVQAVVKGDIASVQQYIKLKKDLVNCKFKELTPLMFASHGGHLSIVKLLLENGANLETLSEDSNTALLIAAAGKKEAIALYILQRGASVKVIGSQKRTVAHHASYFGMNELLRATLQKGINPNQQDVEGDTPLHDAIAAGNDKAVELLLAVPSIDLTLRNNKDFNLLIFAAFKGNDNATEKLLEKSPELSKTTKTDGFSALHIAAINDHQDVAETLLTKGVTDINLKNGEGLTPLHVACHEAYFEMVELLIENAVGINVESTK
ncbi:E3 ubiquitin-protein ligase MIB2-like isoform X2 [Mytilus galloprovincialis]|uniref:E3 ubiquitin-protein ligase MIB2-like isoform X2 n=1 Tax=Mytilus galloprovincialis TaxID=29158 RepID=UPI003F7BC4BA